MAELIQLVYASRATFVSNVSESGIEPHVARVLVQSRINNPKRGLVGALYFADNNFFQVLEGEADEVDALHARLGHDPRHRDIQVLIRRPIEARSFSVWSMKYVNATADIRRLLQLHRVASFDPSVFPMPLVEQVVELLRSASQPRTPEPESVQAALARLEDHERFRALEQKLDRTRLWAIAAMALATTAMGAALFA